MTGRRRFQLGLTYLTLATTPVVAQSWQPVITGTVRDAAGRPITGALVYAPGRPFATRTNSDGGFVFDSLASGYITVRAEQIGYLRDQRDSVRVVSGSPMVLDFQLLDSPLRHDPKMLRWLAPAMKASKSCRVLSPVEPVTDTVPGQRPAVVVLASCHGQYGDTVRSVAHFTFTRSGHLVVRDHRGWERLLRGHWHPDSTGAAPIGEPDWPLESLLVLSVHASGGCGWTYFLHVAGGDSTSVTLELLSDQVLPCQLVARRVYLLRLTKPDVEVRVRERTSMGPIGIAERLVL